MKVLFSMVKLLSIWIYYIPTGTETQILKVIIDSHQRLMLPIDLQVKISRINSPVRVGFANPFLYNYCMRYASRPAIAESRIIDYCREDDSVTWFYHDHKDEKKHIVKDKAVNFINRLILHIPDYHFRLIHYYGFYSNASYKTLNRCHELLGAKKRKDYSENMRKQKRENLLNKLKYRTHLIDTSSSFTVGSVQKGPKSFK